MKKTSLYIIIALILGTSAILWYRAEKKIVTAPSLDTIIVGTNSEFQPFSFKEDDAIVGFDIDVITEVLKRLNKNIIFKDMPFDALLPEIQLGNIHVIAAGITPTPERAQRALFTRPHLAAGNPLVIITLLRQGFEGHGLTSVDELAGKTVVVNEGYVADSYMSEQPGVYLIRLSSAAISDSMLALESGRADAVVAALHSINPYFTKHDQSTFSITPIPGTEESSAFAISKHYPELRDYIQITLDRMKEDGTLDTLKRKWNLV
ncbi:MAG TPA: transporter substrate-binding domain-containing protein [Candidatus Babeliales bacterium]|nr:transporter substrate-binding domain-containing protein [Candidatus Babeliales bacterium]